MKKKVIFILLVLSIMVSALACKEVKFELNFMVGEEVYSTISTSGKEAIEMPQDPTEEGKVFLGWYWDKDTWQKPVTANSFLNKTLKNDIKVYARFDMDKSVADIISAKRIAMTDNIGYLEVEESTEIFSFLDEFEIPLGSTLAVSNDISGNDIIPTKTVHLKSGKNKFYVLVSSIDNSTAKLYEITIYRKIDWERCFIVSNKTITGLTTYGQQNCVDMEIPSKIYGANITSIGTEAFSSCDTLTSITIPSSVTSIGKNAFSWCGSLTNITIPNSVTSIESSAFEGCGSLTSVTIPDSVTIIRDYAFRYCSNLTSITIPDSVTRIGSHAFYGCTSLTSVTIPDSVTSIGSHAFAYCDSLTSVTIPNSVTSIGERAFNDCTSLTSITIPDSVTSIGNYAFYGCTSLTSVTIPDSVTSIGSYAFYGCSNLTTINYTGTEEEWNVITKGSIWNYNTGDYTIVYNYDGE